MSFRIGKLSCVVNSGVSSVFSPQGMCLVNHMFNLQSKPYGVRTMFVESFRNKKINAVKNNCLEKFP